MPTSISPHLFALCSFLTAAITLTNIYFNGLTLNYFFLPVIGLGVFYAGINLYRQKKGCSEFSFHLPRNYLRLFQRALVRYIVWFALIWLASKFYTLIPQYNTQQYRTNHIFFSYFIQLYMYLGLPYFLLTLTVKHSRKEDFYDPVIRIIHVFKQFFSRAMRRENADSVLSVFRSKYNRKVFLNLIMRLYFIPAMIIQVFSMSVATMNAIQQYVLTDKFLVLLMIITSILWLMDVLNASLAYCFESRWLENRARSIDMTFTGWLVCLSCYYPLNQATGFLFPWAPSVATGNPADLVYASVGFLYALKIIETMLLGVHIYCDLSLGTSVANITLRRLQTRGPYGLVRHPGTTTKLLFWLIQSIFYSRFWGVKFVFGYATWGFIYIMRALTEERHLCKFGEYQAYMQKVKYRFIPKIF